MIEHVADSLCMDIDVICTACDSHPTAVDFVRKALWDDRPLVLEVIRRQCVHWQQLPPALQLEKDIVVAFVSSDGCALVHVCPDLIADINVVMAAVTNNGFAIRYAAATLQANPDIMAAALRQTVHSIKAMPVSMRPAAVDFAVLHLNEDRQDMEGMASEGHGERVVRPRYR